MSETEFFACPGRDMPEPEGVVYCYRAGHACPPARSYRSEDEHFVITTSRCPCCGDSYGSTASESVIPKHLWAAAALPEGFTTADGVALMAIEAGMRLEPWQFDWIVRVMEMERP